MRKDSTLICTYEKNKYYAVTMQNVLGFSIILKICLLIFIKVMCYFFISISIYISVMCVAIISNWLYLSNNNFSTKYFVPKEYIVVKGIVLNL